ncbi:hypothetical protein [Microbispora hainanensis]|uniref:Uncharacterized protein n=1 Tax=Microbispora hainanensis TaxID=568844 RepID=A0A544Z309_9ACTN|nr:hypothetical protein [Microbispora hainanensis]TQS23440.1 hypothetical protein FLX08_02955 [Microbispora hainanensis]
MQSGRYIVVNPKVRSELLLDERFISADKYGGGSVITNGEIGRILGMAVYMTTVMHGRDMVVRHQMAVTFANQIVKTPWPASCTAPERRPQRQVRRDHRRMERRAGHGHDHRHGPDGRLHPVRISLGSRPWRVWIGSVSPIGRPCSTSCSGR